jgi:hypothetical protein
MPARNLRNHRTRNERFFNHPGFVVCREQPPTARSRDNLKPARPRCLRLKRKVKLRHNTLSDAVIVTVADSKRQEKVPSKHRLRCTAALSAHFADGERRFQAIVSSCFARW